MNLSAAGEAFDGRAEARPYLFPIFVYPPGMVGENLTGEPELEHHPSN
ncbi:MAG TPA: hypothetical protein VHL11_09805 [Phototrophicaceae bacterium]|nr:hypothetical protein [Phototrophicaceae bacterium]